MSNILDSLTIEGFQSICSLQNFSFKQLNILIGANGAGKSNLISFFKMLQAIMEKRLDSYIRESGGIENLLFNGPRHTKFIKAEMYFGERGYRFHINSNHGVLENEARYYSRGETQWWELSSHIPSPAGHSRLVEEIQKNYSSADYGRLVYDAIISWKIYQFHDTSQSSGMRRSEIVEDKKSLRSNADNLAPYLYFLKQEHPIVYKNIIQTIQLVLPYFDDFILEPEKFGSAIKIKLSWRKKNSDYPMQPYHFSDGSIRFICLATALLQPNPPGMLIIDEPELGLHPAAIAVLTEVIQTVSKDIQIILATQSPTLIDYFEVDDIVVVNQKKGASVFERLQKEDLEKWLEDYRLGELWEKNIIVASPNYE